RDVSCDDRSEPPDNDPVAAVPRGVAIADQPAAVGHLGAQATREDDDSVTSIVGGPDALDPNVLALQAHTIHEADDRSVVKRHSSSFAIVRKRNRPRNRGWKARGSDPDPVELGSTAFVAHPA